MVNADAPATEGVPESTPAGDRVMPSGSVPALTLKASGGTAPCAVSVSAKATATRAAGSNAGAKVIGGHERETINWYSWPLAQAVPLVAVSVKAKLPTTEGVPE